MKILQPTSQPLHTESAESRFQTRDSKRNSRVVRAPVGQTSVTHADIQLSSGVPGKTPTSVGASTEVGVFPGTPLDNWMSACVTDVCPTGALTTREFRFESRVWNLDSAESVCNGCDVGCNMFIGHRNGQVFRYRPRENPDVNDHWLCDYGRFSYERYDTDRVVVPKVRTDDDYLGIATWSEALDSIEKAMKSAGTIAVIAS